MLNAETKIKLQATPEEAWQVLKDLANFNQWNTRTSFTPNNNDITVGKKLTMRVKLFSLWLNVPVMIQSYDKENGLRWVGGIPGLYRGSHYFYCKKQGDQTVFIQGEDFTGLLVPLMWPMLKKELMGLYESGNLSFAKFFEQQQP